MAHQRVVSVYLNAHQYGMRQKDDYRRVEEYPGLQAYLTEGWRVVDMHGVGGASDALAAGWMFFVLEWG